jgi:hypothetical protein
MEPIVPAPDVLPLPAPLWLFQLLLVFTFVLHLVPMNLLFGGSILAAVSHIRGRRDPRHTQLTRRIFELMPVVIAFTVTLGVAPLLFVQVLYGQFIYSSSILMAHAWFAIIPLLIVAYYIAYLLRFKWDSLGGLRTGAAWLVAMIVATVGFFYANNFSLMLRPDLWAAHYAAHPASGHLNWSDPALYPRYLHMMAGALAVAGVWIMVLGARRKSGDQEWSDWAVPYGARMFMHATLLNVLIGLWFLIALPRRVMMIFMGDNITLTVILFAALIFTAAAWWTLHKASKTPGAKGVAITGAVFLLVVLVLMAVMRQMVRAAYLEPYFRLEQLQVAPQWSVFTLFALTLTVGLAVLGWLIRVALRARTVDA